MSEIDKLMADLDDKQKDIIQLLEMLDTANRILGEVGYRGGKKDLITEPEDSDILDLKSGLSFFYWKMLMEYQSEFNDKQELIKYVFGYDNLGEVAKQAAHETLSAQKASKDFESINKIFRRYKSKLESKLEYLDPSSE